MTAAAPAPPDAPPARLIAACVLAFWAGFVALMSARAAVLGFAEPEDLVLRRLACALGGVGLTFLFWGALLRLRGVSLPVQVAAALGGAVPTTALFAALNAWMFYGLKPPPSLAADVARWGFARVFRYAVIDTSAAWYFFFAGGALFLLMLRYALSTAANARRAAAAERAAHVAELRALRYQLNPHFLFNSLNALSCLVLEGRARDADRMILDLSALLRRILAEPPEGDTPLDDEFALQELYLAIEGRRFGERLSARFDLPDALARAPVPPLVLQPLVENAVKHGVGRSSRPVQVSVSARAEGDRLVLEVSDTGADGASTGEGSHGIGLANIRDRLALRYGADASLETLALPGGGFRARVTLPLRPALA
jgi:hypothetical protein